MATLLTTSGILSIIYLVIIVLAIMVPIFIFQIRDTTKRIHREAVTANHWYQKLSQQLEALQKLTEAQTKTIQALTVKKTP